MQHEFRESKKVLTFLGEDENGITIIRRLGKFDKTAKKNLCLPVHWDIGWCEYFVGSFLLLLVYWDSCWYGFAPSFFADHGCVSPPKHDDTHGT